MNFKPYKQIQVGEVVVAYTPEGEVYAKGEVVEIEHKGFTTFLILNNGRVVDSAHCARA